MSLYNALFGVNSLAPLFLAMLDIDQPNGNYDSGRFRDIFLSEDGTRILLYTRNGGGNRDDYQDVFDSLATHPNYVTDYDDDFDCTYATIEFTVPDDYAAECKAMATGKPPASVGAKFQALLDALKRPEATPTPAVPE